MVVLDATLRLLHSQHLLEPVPVPEGAYEVELHSLPLSHRNGWEVRHVRPYIDVFEGDTQALVIAIETDLTLVEVYQSAYHVSSAPSLPIILRLAIPFLNPSTIVSIGAVVIAHTVLPLELGGIGAPAQLHDATREQHHLVVVLPLEHSCVCPYTPELIQAFNV